MNLKCIGGLCDGRTIRVSDDCKYRLGDNIKVQDYVDVLAKPIRDMNIEATIEFYIYRIDCLKYRAQGMVDSYELWFLRYDKLTTWEAIQHQLNK